MKFRKKPVVIEAEQFFPDKKPWPNGIYQHMCGFDIYYISTLEGEMCASPGDWIITGIRGEKYPCKPDIFEQTYDKVLECGKCYVDCQCEDKSNA